MRVCGVVAEYDPFHNGHAYHLRRARELSGADYLVCVISCAFTQRGMPALFSSHDRAQMALCCGADLVLGMPLSFSCSQANRFAAGGIGILCGLQAVTHLSFGAEKDDLAFMTQAAKALEAPDEGMSARLRQALGEGSSFARAVGEALSSRFPAVPAALFRAPNMILGISYIRELLRRDSGIRVLPVRRRGSYHDTAATPFPSATAVRGALLRGDWQGVRRSVPEAVLPLLCSLLRRSRVHPPDALDKALLLKIISTPADSLRRCAEISEGLEGRIRSAAALAPGRERLIEAVKTKRYPYARISRALTNILLDVPAEGLPRQPEYARLLGFRKSALPLLGAIGRSGFPLISRPARAGGREILLDMKAEAFWSAGAGLPGADPYLRQVIIVD